MKVNFDDNVRTFKTLDGLTILQNRFDVLVAVKASEISKTPVRDLKQAVKILEDSGIKISTLFDERGQPLTLRLVCVDVLNTPETSPPDKRSSGSERHAKYKLSERIYNAVGEVELTSENVSMLKQLIADSQYTNIVLGKAYDWLEGVEDEEILKNKKVK